MRAPSLDPESLADTVEAQLREDIVNAVWPAGKRLRMEELRRRYPVGATPIREALSRLLTEGLVVLTNNRGFSVPALGFEDLADISQTRALVEAAAVRDAAAHGDETWEAGIVSAFHVLCRRAAEPLGEAERRQAYFDAHRDFHRALLAGCRSPRLKELQARLEHQHSRYYRQLPFERITAEDLIGEHRKLLDAVLDRDVARLADLVGRHSMLTVERLDPALFSRVFGGETKVA